ncbi:hypothetical protein SLEP1_g59201, partial [Rubroshorea leprosula]
YGAPMVAGIGSTYLSARSGAHQRNGVLFPTNKDQPTPTGVPRC